MQKHTDSHNIVVTDMEMFEINLCVAYASCVVTLWHDPTRVGCA